VTTLLLRGIHLLLTPFPPKRLTIIFGLLIFTQHISQHIEQRQAMKLIYLVMFGFSMICSPLLGQQDISNQEKAEVIASISRLLREDYIYPQIGNKISASLNKRLAENRYSSIDVPRKFASTLTKEIQEISNDQHFYVGFAPDWVTAQKSGNGETVLTEVENKQLLRGNHGFKEVRILEGNIGYLNLTKFENPETAYEIAASSMKFLANTDAMIIDLRYNNGGMMEMAQLIGSYFLKSDPPLTLFDVNYNQNGKRIEQSLGILPFVPGKRTPDKPLYILTSSTSFSCAEWFSYAFQNLKRAIIVGEQTAGGAHPVELKVVTARFNMNVPVGEIKDPITNDDFEGVGVTPDIKATDEMALHVAHREILKLLIENNHPESESCKWFLPLVDARNTRVQLNKETAQSMVGEYEGNRHITLENGELQFRWRERHKVRLNPLSKTLFAVEGLDSFRYSAQFKEGKITGLLRVFDDGNKIPIAKVK